MNLKIEIENVTEAQARAIEGLLAAWVRLGAIGSSQWTRLFADGDGNFQPNITIDGEVPKPTAGEEWDGEGYAIDQNWVAVEAV